MKKKILVSILAVVLAVSCIACFTACQDKNKTDAEYILEKGTLICGITLYEPMNYADDEGEMTGFDTEFAQEVCNRLGIEAKFQVIKWSSKETELNSKYIDCIWNGFTVTEDRKANITFSQSYLNNTQCVVVKNNNLAEYTSADYCNGKTCAVEDGSAGATAAEGLTTGSNITASAAQMTALTELSSGNVDFAVVDIVLAQSVVGVGDYSNLAIATAIELESEEYAIGFRKGSDMAEKVNTVIDAMIQDGTLLTIAQKYGVDQQLIQ